MSRFSYRLKSLERDLLKVDANAFLESLNAVELQGIILAMCKQLLKDAKKAGDRELASDLAVVVKHDATKLSKHPKDEIPTAKRINHLLKQLDEAEDHRPSPGDFEADIRQTVKRQADEIRFDIAFADMFERLAGGEVIEYLDDNQMPIAAIREIQRSDATYWRNFQFTSPYIAPAKKYFDHCRRKRESSEPYGVWPDWRNYCREADSKRSALANKNGARADAHGAKCDQLRPKQRQTGGKNA